VLSARAFRARDDGVLLHHDPFVMLSAIITNIFVDWHRQAPRCERRVHYNSNASTVGRLGRSTCSSSLSPGGPQSPATDASASAGSTFPGPCPLPLPFKWPSDCAGEI
jgi:hypothetical protein